jgi:hypothetical protein
MTQVLMIWMMKIWLSLWRDLASSL